MTCPYCGAELMQIDSYYQGRPESFYGTAANGIHYPQTSNYKILGEIYRCPNSSGFDDTEEAQNYINENPNIEENVDEVVCESEINNGHFYTRNGDLVEGYPC